MISMIVTVVNHKCERCRHDYGMLRISRICHELHRAKPFFPMSKDNRPKVWSSERGDLRKENKKSVAVASKLPAQQLVYIHRESKGRGGKTVSLVKNLMLSERDIKALAKKLKQACGSGGTVKNGIIEIQGEHRQRIAGVLQKLGYKVKISGG